MTRTRVLPVRGSLNMGWKGIIIWGSIIVAVVLVASLVIVAVKPGWYSGIKERFLPRHFTTADEKVSGRKKIVKSQRPVKQAPSVTSKDKKKLPSSGESARRSVVSKRVEQPKAVVPSAPARARSEERLDDYMEIGVLYAQKGHYDKAADLFQKIVKERPRSAEARNNLGFVYLKQGKYNMAEREFNEALKIDGDFVLAYYNLACLYTRKGLDVEAMIYLKKAVQRDERVRLWAMTDEDFETLRSDAVFQELLGTAPRREMLRGRQ